MFRFTGLAIALAVIPAGALAEQPKEVIVTNDTLTVEGEVSAVIAEPLTVEGEVTIGNTVGVDVLSMPDGGASPTTDVIYTNVQVVAGFPTSAESAPLPVPANARLLHSNISTSSNGNADRCRVVVRLNRAGQAIGLGGTTALDDADERVSWSSVPLGRLQLAPGDTLTTLCIKDDDIDDGNCICASVLFYETD